MQTKQAAILAMGLVVGLIGLGGIINNAVSQAASWDRVVTVKGLSEREVIADRVIWPITFIEADNDLISLYDSLASNTKVISQFLNTAGIEQSQISIGRPDITDKLAQQYGGNTAAPFRYSAMQTVTVVSPDVETVNKVMKDIAVLVQKGIVLTDQRYDQRPEFVFTRLNDVKPEMVEEATLKAREVAIKFAADSDSRLGKIKRASQGQFSISERDRYHPHIKLLRVVSTIDYTLVD